MRFVSVCSGVEAASLALGPIGFEAAAFSEVDPFCCELLQQRWPDVPNLGDLTKWREWDLPDAEMLIGGTPCQAWSDAGKRRSMKDERANLALNFVELFHAGGFSCALWENVPGVLNTSDNAFGCFLGGLVGADGPLCDPPDGRWPSAGMAEGPRARVAWGIWNAEHFGVPQRRRRVFVVASAGASRPDPAKILFESKGLRGHPQASGEERADVAGTLGAGASNGGGYRIGADEAATLHVAPTLLAQSNSTGRHRPPGTKVSTVSTVVPTIMHALTDEGFDTSEDGTPLVPIPFDPIQITSGENRSNPQPGQACHTLPADSQAPAVAFDARQSEVCVYGDKTGALDSNAWTNGINSTAGVRRLTPVECERLMGMPDSHTDITYRGKPAADGNRYRAIGNSFAAPVVRWIGQRILEAIRSQDKAA